MSPLVPHFELPLLQAAAEISRIIARGHMRGNMPFHRVRQSLEREFDAGLSREVVRWNAREHRLKSTPIQLPLPTTEAYLRLLTLPLAP
jgi:hypothetical protein